MIARRSGPLTSQALRNICRDRLPAYMVPDWVLLVDHIPVTPGGEKVNRKAIAAITMRAPPPGTAGRSDTEPAPTQGPA